MNLVGYTFNQLTGWRVVTCKPFVDLMTKRVFCDNGVLFLYSEKKITCGRFSNPRKDLKY
jgi:hypothetical protein